MAVLGWILHNGSLESLEAILVSFDAGAVVWTVV